MTDILIFFFQDSSESGSESDFDIRNTGRWRTSSRVLRDLTTPRRLRWRPLDQRRMASSPHRHAQRVFVRRSNGSGSGSMVDPVDVPYIEADEANEDMGTERLPPLRELIWRRFVFLFFISLKGINWKILIMNILGKQDFSFTKFTFLTFYFS